MIKDLIRDLVAPKDCCFCGEPIAKKSDPGALELAARNLWTEGRDYQVQALFAHSTCAVARLHESVPFMPSALIPE